MADLCYHLEIVYKVSFCFVFIFTFMNFWLFQYSFHVFEVTLSTLILTCLLRITKVSAKLRESVACFHQSLLKQESEQIKHMMTSVCQMLMLLTDKIGHRSTVYFLIFSVPNIWGSRIQLCELSDANNTWSNLKLKNITTW